MIDLSGGLLVGVHFPHYMVESFRPGDVVQLKSGGPLMTIDHLGPHQRGSERNEALCSWFETVKGKREIKFVRFELHPLRKALAVVNAIWAFSPIIRGAQKMLHTPGVTTSNK
jgi:uncharacterized protein YodC (DUF2158 family)